jgi:hypothetical protein
VEAVTRALGWKPGSSSGSLGLKCSYFYMIYMGSRNWASFICWARLKGCLTCIASNWRPDGERGWRSL